MSLAEQDKFTRECSNAKAWFESIEEMLAELKRCEKETLSSRNADDARQRIEESVLSVEVRSGWVVPSAFNETDDKHGFPTLKPAEYNILLTTGGPALRIFGQLNHYGEPETAELQMQDWGTYWERYPALEATLLDFARCFYFGE